MEAEQLTVFQTQVYQIYEAYGFYFLVLILAIGAWEIASRIYRRKLSWHYVLDSISSIATLPLIGVMAYLATLIGIGSIYSVGNVIYEQYAIYQAGWSIGSVLLVLLATDFWYYWEHRGFHRINVMWATHTVHHSSDFINIPMAYRFGPLDSFFTGLIHLPLTLFFDPALVLIGIVANQIYQAWIHTDAIKKMPAWFEFLFNTPSHYRVHHGRNEQYIDKNYGGCLIVWDRIFGTFEPEDEPVEYGITKPLKTQDPVTVLFHGLWRLAVKLTTARSAGEILYCFIMPPGWQTGLERERHAGLEGLPYQEKTS